MLKIWGDFWRKILRATNEILPSVPCSLGVCSIWRMLQQSSKKWFLGCKRVKLKCLLRKFVHIFFFLVKSEKNNLDMPQKPESISLGAAPAELNSLSIQMLHIIVSASKLSSFNAWMEKRTMDIKTISLKQVIFLFHSRLYLYF